MSTPTETKRPGRAPRAGAAGGRPVLPMLRAALAVALVSAWLLALFVGWVAGGLAHLLLVAALVAFPWRVAVRGESAVPSTTASNQERELEEIR